MFTGGSVQQAIINGGKKSLVYDYTPGGSIDDTEMHAPTKGNSLTNLFSVSHTTFCFDIVGFVEGTKYLDTDADGDGDTPVEGWTITLDERSTQLTTSTDENGDYSFAVVSGNYTVCEVLPASGNTDWHQSLPTANNLCGGTAGYSVSVQAGVANGGNDFANFETADVSGIKWHDNDTDGTRDPTFEDNLSGWTIRAFTLSSGVVPGASNSTVVEFDETDGNGGYTLTLLTGNDYLICEDTNLTLPSGVGSEFAWAQSSLPAATWGADCSAVSTSEDTGHSLSLSVDVLSGIDFGNHLEVEIVCGGSPVTVTLGGGADPLATITLPAGCQSGPSLRRSTLDGATQTMIQIRSVSSWCSMAIPGRPPS